MRRSIHEVLPTCPVQKRSKLGLVSHSSFLEEYSRIRYQEMSFLLLLSGLHGRGGGDRDANTILKNRSSCRSAPLTPV